MFQHPLCSWLWLLIATKSAGGVGYLVPGLGIASVDLPVWHLVRLLVHPSRAAEDVLLQVWEGVQDDARLVSLPAVQVVHHCRGGRIDTQEE